MTKDDLSLQQVWSYVSTGTSGKDAQHRATKTAMSVQVAETKITVLRSVLEHRKNQALMPYKTSAWIYYFKNVNYSQNTLVFQILWLRDLMLESGEYTRPQPQAMGQLCTITLKLIRKLLTKNLKGAVISVHALMTKLKPSSGLSNHHCCYDFVRAKWLLDSQSQSLSFTVSFLGISLEV